MSANATASGGVGSKAAGATRKRHRLAVAVLLAVLLSGAVVSAGDEDGPAASAPLPPPLPAAPSATGLQQPQGVTPTEASPRAQRAIRAAHGRKRNNEPHSVDRTTRAARDKKRLGQGAIGDVGRREPHHVPQVASTMMPPFSPSPFPFGYIPGVPPAYGYAPVYPAPWPPGPAFGQP